MDATLRHQLDLAIAARETLFDAKHEAAFRLFNGFFEGDPETIVDLYADTLLIQNYAEQPESNHEKVEAVASYLRGRFDWLRCIVLKDRNGADQAARQGRLLFGEKPATRLRENGVRYAFDLQLNRDAGFYLDTRAVRRWAQQTLAGQTVLNCFAYTGSLGVAAMAGQAAHVVQTDLNKRFLNVGKESYTLNGYKINRPDFVAGDFFSIINQFKRAKKRFDAIFVDPPFFAQTTKGEIDLNRDASRLVNKVRPLVSNGGRIILINNALFLSGQHLLDDLERLGHDGFLAIESIIEIDPDITGYPETIVRPPVSEVAPFNHSTKVVVLKVKHKSGRL